MLNCADTEVSAKIHGPCLTAAAMKSAYVRFASRSVTLLPIQSLQITNYLAKLVVATIFGLLNFEMNDCALYGCYRATVSSWWWQHCPPRVCVNRINCPSCYSRDSLWRQCV